MSDGMTDWYEEGGWPEVDSPDTAWTMREDGTWHRSDPPVVDQRHKEAQLHTGLFKYFPDALAEVARVSVRANEQHNPGQPVHWDKSKSKHELDSLLRHMVKALREEYDTDGTRHYAKVAWRALANLQRIIDEEVANGGSRIL